MQLSRILKSLSIILSILAVLAYVGYLVVYVAYAVDLFRWPFDYDQGEGFELYDAILFSQGEWPYRDNDVYPFYASNYPPLFHLLIVPLLPIFGPRVVAGRIVSFVATLITGGAISFVVWRKVAHPGRGQNVRDRKREWLIPLISGLAFFASSYVYQTGPLCRMHMTMVMFETLAIAFFAEFEHPKHGRRNLILGLLMLLCAGYTKQMAVFTVVAALSYVFLRDVKKAIIAGFALAAAAGVIFLLLNVATDGQWWVNTIQANVNEFKYQQTIEFTLQWFRLHTLFVLLAFGYLIYELFWGRLSAYSLWFFFSLGTGLLSGKWGASFNYFSTAVAAGCLVSGLALGHLQRAASRKRTLGEQIDDLADAAIAGAGLTSRLALGQLGKLLRRGGRATKPLDEAVKAVRPRRLSLKQGWHLLQDRLQQLRPWAPALVAVLIPLLYLLQAPRMLHLPTSGPLFGPLARALGVDDQLIEGHCTVFQYHDAMGYTQLGHLLTDSDYAAGEEILDYVRTSDGPVLSEEAMFSLLADELVITNPTQLLNLYKNDLLDTTEIVERINRQEFGVIIFRAQFYPQPVLDAIGQNYKPVETLCMNGFYYHVLWPQRMLDGSAGL